MDTPETQRSPSDLRDTASHLRGLLNAVLQKLNVDLMRLDGSVQRVPLAQGLQLSGVQEDELRREAQTIVLDAKLQTHDHESLAKSRREPESLREWFAAIASGQFAVASTSAVGAIASCAVVVALVAGLVGIGAHNAGTLGLLERAQAVELSLLARASDAEVLNAARKPKVQEQPSECDASPSACPDDAATIAQLRTAFRAAAATALQQAIASAAAPPISLRQTAFRLGAVDARRAILAQSARPAARSLDPGAHAQQYELSTHAPQALTADPIDEAFDRRVAALRSNEPTWRRVRAWAAHPVSTDYVSEAWLRAATGDVYGAQLHALQLWSERASADFATTLATTGDPERGLQALARRHENMPPIGTHRDSRLFRDFAGEAPERVQTQMARYDTGLDDPGSLRRVSANGAGPRTYYDDLFPAVANSAEAPHGGVPGGISGGGVPGGSGGDMRGRPTRGVAGSAGGARGFSPRVAARSFSSIRFSARVGGVVFGREPEQGGQAPDIVAVTAQISDKGRLFLTVDMRDKGRVVLGPYHPAIVQHALAYAADGRVVVSTLPQPDAAEGETYIPARRVVVHPAFEDTAFACSAIQIDRFVDTFTTARVERAPSPLLEKIATARDGVTALGFLLSSDLDRVPKEMLLQELEALYAYARACTDDSACFPLKQYTALGLELDSGTRLVQCMRGADTSPQIGECWRGFRDSWQSGDSYSVDSGVRERAYKIDPRLDFVSGKTTGGDIIEFMIQAVPVKTTGEDAPLGGSENQDPWQFPQIAAELHQQVIASIPREPGAQAIYNNVRDFVALQRFFRTALDGSLGSTFPLHDLVKLSAQTRPYVQPRQHERWNMNRPLIRMLGEQRDQVVAELERTVDRGQASTSCTKAASRTLAAERKAPWPEQAAVWKFVAAVDSVCAADASMSTVREIQGKLQQQELLGEVLLLEEMRSRPMSGMHCEPL
jgi:hypothetical protein